MSTDKKPVTFSDWNRLDKFETEIGAKLGKPREKVTNIQKMIDISHDWLVQIFKFLLQMCSSIIYIVIYCIYRSCCSVLYVHIGELVKLALLKCLDHLQTDNYSIVLGLGWAIWIKGKNHVRTLYFDVIYMRRASCLIIWK